MEIQLDSLPVQQRNINYTVLKSVLECKVAVEMVKSISKEDKDCLRYRVQLNEFENTTARQ